jgi:hypothetical protein
LRGRAGGVLQHYANREFADAFPHPALRADLPHKRER